MRKNIVVTGGTGFVGSNLITLLVKEYNVYAIVREYSDLSYLSSVKGEVNFFEYSGDLNDLVTFFKEIQPECVFHLASKFIAEHKLNEVDSLINSNVLFSTYILEAMKEAGVRKMVNAGTSWQHYNNEIYNPVCLYAATKQAFESIIEYYVQAENFSVITLVLFDTYGENDKRPKLINLLGKFADEGIVLDMSAGEQQLNLVHISDVCSAFIKAFQLLKTQNIGHKHYVVRTDEIYSLKEIVDLFEKQSGKRIKINWGARPYRKREVMEVWEGGEKLPDWNPKITLKEGFNRKMK